MKNENNTTFEIISCTDVVYRGKRISDEKWIYGNLNNVNNKTYIAEIDDPQIIHVSKEDAILKVSRVWKASVCVYSFEKDVDGNDIYSNDVLISTETASPFLPPNTHVLVLYLNGACVGGYFNREDYVEVSSDVFSKCRLVGNVCDQPELYELFPAFNFDE